LADGVALFFCPVEGQEATDTNWNTVNSSSIKEKKNKIQTYEDCQTLE